jgi:hypothetical protein
MAALGATTADSSEERARQRRDENPLQRADRNMGELLQELRVAQIGVQILFAGLISVAFTERFGRIEAVQRGMYVVALLLAVVSAGLLIAPAAVHRMLFAMGAKPQTVQLGHRLFQAGLATLALTVAAAVLLVMDVTVGRGAAIGIAAAVLVLLAALWFVLPLPVRRAAERAEHHPGR